MLGLACLCGARSRGVRGSAGLWGGRRVRGESPVTGADPGSQTVLGGKEGHCQGWGGAGMAPDAPTVGPPCPS